jgi:hypothetical protein
MDEDLKMSEMTPRGRKTKVPIEPEDWVALGVAILGLGALVVAVIATKAAPEKATPASSEAVSS